MLPSLLPPKLRRALRQDGFDPLLRIRRPSHIGDKLCLRQLLFRFPVVGCKVRAGFYSTAFERRHPFLKNFPQSATSSCAGVWSGPLMSQDLRRYGVVNNTSTSFLAEHGDGDYDTVQYPCI